MSEPAERERRLCDRTGIAPAQTGELKHIKITKINKFYRGVAKLVSRQFRVLEIVGSSPATSTKTVFLTVFSFFGRSDRVLTQGFSNGSKI